MAPFSGVEVSKTLDDLKRLTNDIMPKANAIWSAGPGRTGPGRVHQIQRGQPPAGLGYDGGSSPGGGAV